uniref:Uncharacterized protein n=1 Tax=viral metagenome TaxID=1070528 RepID=A0A6C0D1X5_9ZZZZ
MNNKLIFQNPDMSLYIGKIDKIKIIKPISIINYPNTKFKHISVILQKNDNFFDNNRPITEYIPSDVRINIPNNVSVSFLHSNHEEFFTTFGYTIRDHLHVIDNILIIIR